MSKNLIEVEGLKKYFNVGKGKVLKAVDNINFSIREGETLGMVGESGCGKTTAGRTVLRLYEPTAGSVKYNGTDIYKLSAGKMKALRRDMQMIFQDPYASLNPRLTVSDIIGEALDIHGMAGSRAERKKRIEELLDMVGLNHDHATRYPHEFSGGQRQRIGIARSLAVNLSLSSATSRFPHLTCPFRHRLSTCSKNCRTVLDLLISLSRMICPWLSTSVTVWR